ncbi:hypothetical protein D3C80_2079050 [compost metagenome]
MNWSKTISVSHVDTGAKLAQNKDSLEGIVGTCPMERSRFQIILGVNLCFLELL